MRKSTLLEVTAYNIFVIVISKTIETKIHVFNIGRNIVNKFPNFETLKVAASSCLDERDLNTVLVLFTYMYVDA